MKTCLSACDTKTTELTKDNVEKIIEELSLMKYDNPVLPMLPKYKSTWFEKFMNKFGWYRKTTVYVIDSDVFKMKYPMGVQFGQHKVSD